MDFSTAGDSVLKGAALVVALGVLAGAGIRLYRFIDRMEDAWRAVTKIAAETQPNGGASLRDAVDTTKKNITELVQIAGRNRRDIDRLLDGQARLDTRIESINGWLFASHMANEALTENLTTRDPAARTRVTDSPEERENT